jgi:hypothetical protein
LDAELPDTGLTRINLPGGGLIEPVTASALSRLGQRVTFVLADETHGWVERNGGKRLADNQRRNAVGDGGSLGGDDKRVVITDDSVAQDTFENPVGVFVDYPSPSAAACATRPNGARRCATPTATACERADVARMGRPRSHRRGD